MPQLSEWDSFYVVVGGAAGALIGLQFVVLALIAERPSQRLAEASAAFTSPTIVHFSSVLGVAALLRVPWHAVLPFAIVCGVVGAAGLIYVFAIALRVRRQSAYRPELEDWVFHLVLPFSAYGAIAAAGLVAPAHPHATLLCVAGGTLLLLFDGIHNAWDGVSYFVFVHIPKTKE